MEDKNVIIIEADECRYVDTNSCLAPCERCIKKDECEKLDNWIPKKDRIVFTLED